MKKIILLFIFVLPFSSWAKIITKAEVKKRFIQAVADNQDNFSCVKEKMILIPESIEISLPENPLYTLRDIFGSNNDVYEVHADFKSGKVNYHYNTYLSIQYFGTDEENDALHEYGMFDDGSISFYRKSTGETKRCIDGSIVYSWKLKNTYY